MIGIFAPDDRAMAEARRATHMRKTIVDLAGQENRLIELLPQNEAREFLRLAKRVRLTLDSTIARPDQRAEYLYFPERSVISAVANFAAGASAEMTAIGREGFAPVSAVLGADSPLATYIVQVPGNALQVSRSLLFSQINRFASLQAILNRYLMAFMGQILQSVACNATHTVEQRCARWLLTIRDRTRSETFQLTHEYLGEMLGVRRQHVSVVARTLQLAGLIRYHRGIMTIVDSAALERATCECYDTIARIYREQVETGLLPPTAIKSRA
jgi:CRP-like cAMP-binding protein